MTGPVAESLWDGDPISPCHDCGHAHHDHDPAGPCCRGFNKCDCEDWRPTLGGHHCLHGGSDLVDPDCCICEHNPCSRVTVARAIVHGRDEMDRERQRSEQQADSILSNGHRVQEAPF